MDTETKKKIDEVRSKYVCAGDAIFRSAINVLFNLGKDECADEEWVGESMYDINKRYEENSNHLIMSKEFEKAIIECAHDLAVFRTTDLLQYIQTEVYFGSNEISYKRAIELLKNCIEYCIANTYETEFALKYARDMGFHSEEIKKLGYEYLFDTEEEEEE